MDLDTADFLATPDERTFSRATRITQGSGEADVRCESDEGTLRTCTVGRETPRNRGMGQAAVLLAASYRIRPRIAEGRPVDGDWIVIPMRFTQTTSWERTRRQAPPSVRAAPRRLREAWFAEAPSRAEVATVRP